MRKLGICGAYSFNLGGWQGGQAEYMWVPWADFQLLKFPIKEQAIEKISDLTLLSDILRWGRRISARLGHPVKKSCGLPLLSCDMDIRTGGQYRLEFRHHSSILPSSRSASKAATCSPADTVRASAAGSNPANRF
jgi:hypothetical protein